MKEIVVQWDNSWRYDHWWRQKYKIAFNSKEHQEASQFDIAFEYMESYLFELSTNNFKKQEEKEKRFKKDGWISESTSSKSKNKKAFDNLDISKL